MNISNKYKYIFLSLFTIIIFIVGLFCISAIMIFINEKTIAISFEDIIKNIQINWKKIVMWDFVLSISFFISIFLYFQFFNKKNKNSKIKLKNENEFLIDKRKKEFSTKKNEIKFGKEIIQSTTTPSVAGSVVRWEPTSSNSEEKKWWVLPENHMKVVATTGGGKSQFVMIPNIIYNSLLPHEVKSNLVIIDPKGELYQNTANILKKNKFDVIRIDFGNGFNSIGWNPLARIWDLLMSKDINTVNDGIKEFNLLLNTIELLNAEKSAAPIWPTGAKNIVKSAMFLMIELGKLNHINKKQFNFFNLKILISDSTLLIDLFIAGESTKRIKEILTEYKSTLTAPEATLGSFLANAGSALEIFNQELAMQSLLSRNEFDAVEFNNDSTNPKALFISYPDDDSTNHALISILISQIYSSATSQAKKNKSLSLKRRLQFIIDEFGILTTIPNFDQWMNISRSRNIFFNVALQSDVQIKIKYPKTFQSILNGFNSNIFISSKDDKDHESLSKRIGKKDVENISINENDKKDSSSKSYSSKAEDLISIQELVTLGNYYVLETTSKSPAILEKHMAYNNFNLKNQANLNNEFQEFDIQSFKVDFQEILNSFKNEEIINGENGPNEEEVLDEDILSEIQQKIDK